MDPDVSQALYERYAGAVAFVEVVDENGDFHLGTAFHIGGGLLATARHVVEAKIERVATTEQSSETFTSVLGTQRVETLSTPIEIRDVPAPRFHPDADVDVALLELDGFEGPAVPLVDLDPRPGARVALEPVLILGYPLIPQSVDRPLVATTCEVSAEVQTIDKQRVLILSAPARAGLSGGPVLAASGSLRGLMIRSLVEQVDGSPEPANRGILAAMEPDAIKTCVKHHGLVERVPAMEF
jgi:S1-C subfamily serine protease